ncbi:glycosyltransferase family 2 protein [Dysgonomonas sp. ZJ279]|uniref:glycosyltransferase family 2 protein n=1 Tax=Dysgonomonas sp. ZJ279 TaxID=2709796 RepID=UPI0013EDCBEE|nr:glycosyltransferase [Dysgonomonas sp. ZJ279]
MNNKDKRLTIVVPAYNAEKYIEKCISSLLCQDLTDYEIIVVNDGSTDRTQDIVSDMALENSNVSLINQGNKGLGGARNTGLRNASGEYVMFVDSDDYLEPNSLSILLDKIVKDQYPDVLYADFTKVDTEGNPIQKIKEEMMVVYAPQVVDAETFFSQYYAFICYAVLFVFKREFLLKHAFNFKENVYMEDAEGIPKILILAERISMLCFPFYNYVQTPDSIMRDNNKIKKRLGDYIYIIEQLVYTKKNIDNINLLNWFNEFISLNIIMTINTLSEIYSSKTSHLKKTLKLLVKSNKLYIKRLPVKYKIMSWIININFDFAFLLIRLKKRL